MNALIMKISVIWKKLELYKIGGGEHKGFLKVPTKFRNNFHEF